MHAVGVIIGDIPSAIEAADQLDIFFTFFHHFTPTKWVIIPMNS